MDTSETSHDSESRATRRSSPIVITALCSSIAVMDGFDIQVVGFAASGIAKDWGMAESRFGTMFSAGFVGGVLGALLAGYFYRLFGKRGVLCLCLCWFSIGSFLSAAATSELTLLLVRFATGIGLGVAIPVLFALVTQAAPPGMKGRAMAFITGAAPFGGMLAGVVAALVAADYGWRWLFVTGGILPLLLIPAVLRVSFGSESSASELKIERVSKPEGTGWLSTLVQTGRAIAALFGSGRALSTLAVVVGFGLAMLLAITLSSWTPLLLRGFEWTDKMSAVGGTVLNAGALVSIFCFGYLLDRFRGNLVIATSFLLGGASLVVLGYVSAAFELRLALLAIAGFFTVGPTAGIQYLISLSFADDERVDAMGLALFVGRTGAFVGPILIGLLIAAGWGSGAAYIALACSAASAAFAVLLFSLFSPGRSSQTIPAPAA